MPDHAHMRKKDEMGRRKYSHAQTGVRERRQTVTRKNSSVALALSRSSLRSKRPQVDIYANVYIRPGIALASPPAL
jgi:hypothetical protein